MKYSFFKMHYSTSMRTHLFVPFRNFFPLWALGKAKKETMGKIYVQNIYKL